jgi:outer membrane protein assembly factor BamB
VLTVVAVLAATGLGGWFYFFKDAHTKKPAYQAWSSGRSEAGGVGELLWETPQPNGEGDYAVQTPGLWFTENHLVKRTLGRVAAYDLETGEEAWEFPLGDVTDECHSSEEQSGGRVALLRSSGDPDDRECATLTVLDITDGTEVFTEELPRVHDYNAPGFGDVPVVIGDIVAVSSDAGGHLLDLATGERRNEVPTRDDECFDFRYAAFGDILLAKHVCRTAGNDNGSSGTGGSLKAFGPDLSELWEWEVPETPAGGESTLKQVVSADPLVVEVNQNGTYVLWAVDPADGTTVELNTHEHGDIHGRTSDYDDPCMIEQAGMRACPAAVVADGKVILIRQRDRVDPSDWDAMTGYRNATEYQNQLAAVDLATGEEVWRTERREGRLLSLLGVEDGKIVAYQKATPHQVPAMVVAVDPADGTDSALLPVTDDEALAQWVRSGELAPTWHDGRLYLLNHLHSDERELGPETMVFGLRK